MPTIDVEEKKKFEDTKGVIRRRKSNNRQHNGQKFEGLKSPKPAIDNRFKKKIKSYL
jgi:hypothetical protein